MEELKHMKVCVVVLNSIWYDPRVRKQINSYMTEGFDISCVGYKCNRFDEQKVSQVPCRVVLADYDPAYKGKQSNVFRKLKREQLLNKALTEAIVSEKPDVIHANDLDALIPAYSAAKKLKCKLIYDSHEIFTENIQFRNKKIYAYYLRLKEYPLCKRVDKMICVSNAAAEYFAKKYKIKKPEVITNCTLSNERVFSDSKKDCFEVLNHGQFYDGRGYDKMVEALPLLKDYPEIKLALRGMGTLEADLKARAKELGDDNIIFYPPVHVKDLIKEASDSMVGVAVTEPICLNFVMSVSNKLFEYAAAGLPVIMSDIPEHRYLNKKYEFGIILPENTPEAFAEAVIKLYTDKEFYDKCAKNSEKLTKELCWENEFSKITSFLKE